LESKITAENKADANKRQLGFPKRWISKTDPYQILSEFRAMTKQNNDKEED